MSTSLPHRLRADAATQGRRAYVGGYPASSNPFAAGTAQHQGFDAGWREAARARVPQVAPHPASEREANR